MDVLLDTCAIWFAATSQNIAALARRAVEAAERKGTLHLSPVSAWEFGLLARHGRLPPQLLAPNARDAVLALFQSPAVRVPELTPAIAYDSANLPEPCHGDPADRFLIATARALSLTLVTRDRKILEYGARGHVSVLKC